MIGYSSDGVNWTAKQVTGMWLYGVAYGNGKYIAVGGNESISYICYSTDDVQTGRPNKSPVVTYMVLLMAMVNI